MKKSFFLFSFIFVVQAFFFAQSANVNKQKFGKRAEKNVDTICARFSGMNDGYFTYAEIDSLCKWLNSKTYEKEVCYMSDKRYNKCNETRETVLLSLKKDLYALVGVKLNWQPAKWGFDEHNGWIEAIIKSPTNTFKMLMVFCYSGKNDFTIRSYSPYFTEFSEQEMKNMIGNK